jgi:hypothetical protein
LVFGGGRELCFHTLSSASMRTTDCFRPRAPSS